MSEGAAAHEALASQLADVVPEVLRVHPPLDVEGHGVAITLAPTDAESLSRCLAALDARGAAVRVQGGGSRIAAANPPARLDCVLSTRALAGVDEFDVEDGVVRVGAGTTLRALREVVDPEGWTIGLDAWGPDATVGGVLSASAVGPRRLGLGPPRDQVLGLDVVLASGERTRCGGRVVKNVTGYDLAKLYTGAHGSLGVIERAWLRLRPSPEDRRTFVGVVDDLETAAALGLAVSRRESTQCCALVPGRVASAVTGRADAREGAFWLVAELAGDAPVVVADAKWIGGELSTREADGDVIARLATLEGGPAWVRARTAVLPSAVAGLARDLGDALLSFHPGTGLLHAGAPSAEGDDAEAADRAAQIASAAGEHGAAPVFDALPLALRRERDVFGEPGPERRLMEQLKLRFDPNGVLNPGCVQGRL